MLISEIYVVVGVTSVVVDVMLNFLTDDSSLVVATADSSVKSPMSVISDDSVITQTT